MAFGIGLPLQNAPEHHRSSRRRVLRKQINVHLKARRFMGG